MTILTDITTAARHHLRDFPRYFQVTPQVLGRTYKLPHQNIVADRLVVGMAAGGTFTELVAGTGYELDDRNGVVRLAAVPGAGMTLMVEGYYYEWLTDDDLNFHAKISMHDFSTATDPPIESRPPVVLDLIAMAAVVEALWSLLLEFSRDIDVSTPEAVHVPASQRYRMLRDLLAEWAGRYKEKATLLNVGLAKIETYDMRRVSLTTGRLVPLYKLKEYGDTEPIERRWPSIPSGDVPADEPPEDLRDVVYIEEVPPSNGTAWSTETYGI